MSEKGAGARSRPAKRTSEQREARRKEVLEAWAVENRVSLDRLDLGQQWVVFAALEVIAFLGAIAALKRVVGYLLAHSGMDLGGLVIAAIVGVSDRAVRQAKTLAPKQMLHSVRHPIGGHRKPKLRADHAGVIAKYLVEHPRCQVIEMLDFVRANLGVEMDRLTLRRYLKRYGLGCLRGEMVAEPVPLFSVARSMEARSS